MVLTRICICGKQLIDTEDQKFHLTEHPNHIVDVQQWEYVELPAFGAFQAQPRWLKVGEWSVQRRKNPTMDAPVD